MNSRFWLEPKRIRRQQALVALQQYYLMGVAIAARHGRCGGSAVAHDHSFA